MMDVEDSSFDAVVFANRGLLLAVPAVGLALGGRVSASSIALGLPLAFLGEGLRVWAVGYSGVTTRGAAVEAPRLVTAGPYAYVRNPLYVGNALTALGFAIALTGRVAAPARLATIATALGVLVGVYAVIIPHEERFLRRTFGADFEAYEQAVKPVVPRSTPYPNATGTYDPSVIGKAETRTFVTFGAMLLALIVKALRTDR